MKDLPTNEQGQLMRFFTANGVQYEILPNDEAFTPEREAWLRKFSTGVFFGKEDTVLYEDFRDVQQLVQEGKNLEAILALEALREGLYNRNKFKYAKACYICSLFIIRKGEDIGKYDMEHDGRAKIDDWNAENFKASTFFLLASKKLSGLFKMLNEQTKKMPNVMLRNILDSMDVSYSEKINENLSE